MKKILIYVVILGALTAGGYAAYHSYRNVRQARLLKEAQRYLEKNNDSRALLFLRRALSYNTNDVTACRLMGRLEEKSGRKYSVYWLNRVVDLNPRSVDDRLALARAALTFNYYSVATNALEGVDAAGRKTAAYQIVAGSAAAAAGQTAEAVAHFQEASRLDPQNGVPRLNLAVIRLQGSNDALRAEARGALEGLASASTNYFLRSEALRELFVDAARSKKTDRALALSAELLRNTNSIFNDRILRLELLQQARKTEFKSALAEAQREAVSATNLSSIRQLANWEMENTTPTQTLGWLTNLPKSAQTNWSVASPIAECQLAAQDWKSAANFLKDQDWGEMEHLRHALRARAMRGLDLRGGASGEWEMAVKSANGQADRMAALVGLAEHWKWQSESEELLWSVVKTHPGEDWAVHDLTHDLFSTGRTRSMLDLCVQQSKRAPDNLQLKRNLAMLALLLDAKELQPNDLAREVYEKSTTNASFAVTYAFSLLTQHKNAEALQVMRKLTPNEVANPAVAGYYGLVLEASGDRVKARTYLDLALKNAMLPEERKLFERARGG